MNRAEFMRQLEILLQNISPAEREEALQYYNDYFDDAGAENEQIVIEALGTPKKVADNIRRDLYGRGYGEDAFEKGMDATRAIVRYQEDDQENHQKNTANAQETEPEGKKFSTGAVILLVLLCVMASPVLLGMVSGVLGIIAGAIATWFSLIVGFGAAALALFAVMFALLLIGLICVVHAPLVGMMLLGGGLICGGVGILFLMLTVAMAGVATPAICRWIAGLFGRVSKKKPAAA